MKRIAAVMLLMALSLAWPVPARAQSTPTVEDMRRSEREAKRQQKALAKASKKQQKEMEKYEKAQRKAAKKAQRGAQQPFSFLQPFITKLQ